MACIFHLRDGVRQLPMPQSKPQAVPQSSRPQSQTNSLKIYLRLLGYVKPFWLFFVLSIIGLLGFAATEPLLVKLTGELIDAVERGNTDDRIWLPLAVVGIFVIRGIAGFVGSYFMAHVAQGIVHTLRTELFNQLTTLPGRYFDDNNSGHLISRITYDVTGVTTAATSSLKVIVRQGGTVLALLGFMLYTDWRLTLIFFAVAPVIGGIISVVGKRLRRLSSKVQVVMGNITHVCSEMINGYREMRTFGGEVYEQQRFDKVSSDNRKQNLKIALTSSATTPIIQILIAVAMGALFYAAFGFIENKTSGEFVAYLMAAGLIPKPMRQLTEVIADIQKGVAAAASVFQQLDELSESDSGELEADRVQGQLSIKNLSFAYNADEGNVLHDINLEVTAGQVVALVGRSGSGKTTLASLIPRFYHHSDGEILIDSTPLQDYKLINLRRQTALVNQNVTLFNDTVANNIAYGDLAGASIEEIRAAAKSAHALEFIEQMPEGFDTLIGEDGTRLSGGQRQRLAIARALLKDAPLLILDEATSALDTESERAIQQALEEVMKGRTTLVIAHRLSTIENADKIVVMEQGRIVEQGSHSELLAAQGAYAKLHNMQFAEE